MRAPERKRSMENVFDKPASELYSAKNSRKPINFYIYQPLAKSVQITGDFNHWAPLIMQRRPAGWWFTQVLLTHGHHAYRFVVDGKPTLDPQASGIGRDSTDEEVSIVAVS